MFSFIKRHWIPYLVGAVLALILGFCAAWFIGVKGSTPADVREERVAAEKERGKRDKEMVEEANKDSSNDSGSADSVKNDEGSADIENDGSSSGDSTVSE